MNDVILRVAGTAWFGGGARRAAGLLIPALSVVPPQSCHTRLAFLGVFCVDGLYHRYVFAL